MVKVSQKQLNTGLCFNLERVAAYALALGLVATLSACSSTGALQSDTQTTGIAADGQVVVNPELMRRLQEAQTRAQQMLSEGKNVEVALEPYRKLAKAYPQHKEPWVHIAQSYFDAHRYGEAIVAAGEVQKRDANDQVALSIVAVSGLRAATESLSALKEKGGYLGKNMTRADADRIVRLLRGTTGERVLVPKPDVDAPVVKNTTRRATSQRATAKPAAAPVGNTHTPSATPSAPGNNPFLKLN